MGRKNPLTKPFLKWAGGKRQLIPEIAKHVPKFSTYYEPFVGAGAVFFHLQPNRAIINDSNSQLIMTYRVIKDNLDELIAILELHKQNNSEKYYYKIRELDREPDVFKSLSDAQKAARLIYLNKTCYNGLYRVNSQGLFNVPYGRYKNPVIYEPAVLLAINKSLNSANVTIMDGDYADALINADKKSFVYLDPPYHSPDNTNFTGYQAGGFDEKEQIRLRDTYKELTNRGVRCLLSNSDTSFIRELYRDFTIETVEVSRAINSNPDGRGKVNEVLIKNY
ncbi:MAG TPA: DNA adenine methylase [Gelria sp.]|nr:DNA adenine methylase [Gelria sp.]